MAYPDFPVEQPVTYRRYLLLKRHQWRDLDESGMEGVFRGMQEAQPGNALPATFPYLAELAAGGYTTREDLTGAEPRELWMYAGLGPRDAADVLEALANLPPV